MRIVLPALALFVLGSCATPTPVRVPPPTSALPRPAAAPPPPAGSDWRDWPVTIGDWRYARTATGSEARFGAAGTPTLRLACDRAARTVAIDLAGAGGSAIVRTSSTARTLTLAASQPGVATATLASSDPLLDAMGFSRGRFVVERSGTRALVIPAWPEILRVTEDCRG